MFLGRFRSSWVVLACSSLLWVMAACSGCSSFYKRRLHIIFSLSNLLKMTRIWTRIFTRWGSCIVLQNRASVITEQGNFFILQSRVSGIRIRYGLQSETIFITKRRSFYYKVGLVLLNGIFATKQGRVIIIFTTTTLLKWHVTLMLRRHASLREKCLKTAFFLVCIFLHLDWIRRDTPYLFEFSPNEGKYGPEKLRIGHFSRSAWSYGYD